jgi:phosphoribosylaminoimidazole-succinocarboxamide synthase
MDVISPEVFDSVAEMSLKIFNFGNELVSKNNLILVDTKYEFGTSDGKVMVIDEMHTPDSSRFWFKDSYQQLFQAGQPQRKIDKEYVREWYAAQGFIGDGTPPELADEVRVEAAKRYIQAYEMITGKEFEASNEPVEERILQNLKEKGYM